MDAKDAYYENLKELESLCKNKGEDTYAFLHLLTDFAKITIQEGEELFSKIILLKVMKESIEILKSIREAPPGLLN